MNLGNSYKMLLYSTVIHTPIGPMVGQCTEQGITGLWFTENVGQIAVASQAQPLLRDLKLWLASYFAGQKPDSSGLPLKPAGTAYQQAVWQALLQVPYGQTCAYGAVAQMLAKQGLSGGSARSCGTAIGKNPIGIIIPCHRIIRKNGQIGGYAGGLERKRYLLRHEKAQGWL